jgi:hypothetical protein
VPGASQGEERERAGEMSAPLARVRFPQARGYVPTGVSTGVVIAEGDDLLDAASQQQMASDITRLKADEQDVFDKISSASPPRPAAAPARKSVSVAPPLQSSETSPVR